MKKTIRYLFLSITFLSACIALGISKIAWMCHVRTSEMPEKTNLLHSTITSKTRKKTFARLAEIARLYFLGKNHPTWSQGIQPTQEQLKTQMKIFQYPLGIEHIIDNDPSLFINHKRPTIFFHGWADTKNCARLLKAFCDVLPGDIVTFNFRDRGTGIPKLRHSNLGQLPDVLCALYVVKWVKDTLAVNEVDLFGYSRGGAVILNMLAVLNDKTNRYDRELATIGIDKDERITLLTMIQRGCIVLDCPLTNVNVSAHYRFGKLAPRLLKTLEQIGHYQITGIQALESAQNLEGLKLTLLLHFQYQDRIVSNENESELYARLAQHNPDTTYIVLGNNGGHIHTHAALAHTIHTFKKQYGSSYDPSYDAQYQLVTTSRCTDANTLLQPKLHAKQVISNYYRMCTSQYS